MFSSKKLLIVGSAFVVAGVTLRIYMKSHRNPY